MKTFFQVLREGKEMKFIFAIFTVMILLGIGCVIFAVAYPGR